MGFDYSVKYGKILVYHLFDVADEINLEQLRQNWMGEATLIKLVSRRAAPHYIQFATFPLLLPLGLKTLNLTAQEEVNAEVNIKIFDYGVVSICWELPFPDTWAAFVPRAPIYIDNTLIEEQSRDLLESIHNVIKPALVRQYTAIDNQFSMEDYTIFYVQKFGSDVSAENVLEDLGGDIASVVRGETKPLSTSETQQILSQQLSYFQDDLVVSTWNSSFIFDTEGSSEHVDMLEFANCELLELRYYDNLLDRELETIYDELQKIGRSTMFKNPYSDTMRKILFLVLEITELTDKIENALKIVGDLYSARVYRLIAGLLQLKEWHARVDGKLANAQQIYEALNSELHSRRSTFMEVIVIVLIALEVLLFFLPIHH